MQQVVDHLIERGYRSVAYVSGSSGATQIIRHDALVAALRKSGREAPVVHRADGVDAEGMGVVAAEIRQSRPDVVVCYDDKTALLLMDELRAAGVRVPHDIGIVGFDDIPFARISNPRLTTVSQRADDLGRFSVTVLLAAVDRGKLPPTQSMPVNLVVRETTPGPADRASKKGARS
ncbi:MAG TPA: substrate-binding domain-containing protein, partial [Ilumatobacteraceae bacterium]